MLMLKGVDSMNGETTNLSIRMDKALKEQAEVLFSELGVNMTTALKFGRSQI
jgi:DNA-damage-inducible protein J